MNGIGFPTSTSYAPPKPKFSASQAQEAQEALRLALFMRKNIPIDPANKADADQSLINLAKLAGHADVEANALKEMIAIQHAEKAPKPASQPTIKERLAALKIRPLATEKPVALNTTPDTGNEIIHVSQEQLTQGYNNIRKRRPSLPEQSTIIFNGTNYDIYHQASDSKPIASIPWKDLLHAANAQGHVEPASPSIRKNSLTGSTHEPATTEETPKPPGKNAASNRRKQLKRRDKKQVPVSVPSPQHTAPTNTSVPMLRPLIKPAIPRIFEVAGEDRKRAVNREIERGGDPSKIPPYSHFLSRRERLRQDALQRRQNQIQSAKQPNGGISADNPFTLSDWGGLSLKPSHTSRIPSYSPVAGDLISPGWNLDKNAPSILGKKGWRSHRKSKNPELKPNAINAGVLISSGSDLKPHHPAKQADNSKALSQASPEWGGSINRENLFSPMPSWTTVSYNRRPRRVPLGLNPEDWHQQSPKVQGLIKNLHRELKRRNEDNSALREVNHTTFQFAQNAQANALSARLQLSQVLNSGGRQRQFPGIQDPFPALPSTTLQPENFAAPVVSSSGEKTTPTIKK